MPPRALTLGLAVIAAGAGYVGGRFSTRTTTTPTAAAAALAAESRLPPQPPPIEEPRAAAPQPRAEPQPLVSQPQPPAATRPRPPLPALPREAPSPAPRDTTPSLAGPRPPSPLQAFRFAGLGPAGGLRLARVRPGTLPAALGLQTGDELLTINNFRITDPEQALLAYSRLRTADRLQLAISRLGQRTELVYFIR